MESIKEICETPREQVESNPGMRRLKVLKYGMFMDGKNSALSDSSLSE